MVIDLKGEIAVWCQKVADIEVSDEGGRGSGCIITIAELTVDKKPVIEQPAGEKSLVFCVVPSFVARGDVGTEIPFVAFDDCAENGVDLS